VALLCSSAGYAATVAVTVTENSFITNDGLVNVGDSFFVTVSGAGFPNTVGASLTLLYNSAAVAITGPVLTNGIVLAPGSPFTGGIVAPDPFPSGSILNILAPPVGALPNGSFDAFRINFTAIGEGFANIVLFDDQVDNSWTDAITFGAIPVTYTQASSVQVIPVPAAVWLFGSALGLLGVARRRMVA
jgi:hypothetical protein